LTTRETREHAVRQPPFGAPHVFVLAVVDGEQPSGAYRMCGAETLIGRGAECGVTVEDNEVSKQHCVVRIDGPVGTVADLGSLNGTWVNGRRLRDAVTQRLRHLDEIQVGTTRLMVLTGRFRGRPKGRD